MKLYESLTEDELKSLTAFDWTLETPAKVTIWAVTQPAKRASGRTLCEAYRNLANR